MLYIVCMAKEKISEERKKEWSERRRFVNDLIQEFRRSLREQRYGMPLQTNGVMVLSAPPSLEFKGDTKEMIAKREKNPENMARIKFGIEIIKQIVSQKLLKPISELTPNEIRSGPPLILNGEKEQIEPMKEVALAEGFPEDRIILINCGDRGIGNTKMQFLETAKDPILGKSKHLMLITSSYHTPRLARTAAANLPENMNLEIAGVPFKEFSYDIYRKVRGEVKRIVAYSAKGDITKYPRESK